MARAYAVGFQDATAAGALASGQAVTLASRYTVVPGGGYLPSPVSVVLELNGKLTQGVISGTYVQTPPSAQLNWHYRVFWS